MVPFTARQLISVRLFALCQIPLSKILLVFSRATICSGTIQDEIKKMGTMPQSKSCQQSLGLQTTLFSVDRLASPKSTVPAVATSVRRTGIVCEIGPSSKHISTLANMIENGMTIAKINYWKFPNYYTNCCDKTIMDNLQKAAEEYSSRLGVSWPIAIAMETTHHIRTGTLINGLEEVELFKGDTVKVVFAKSFEESCSAEVIWINYPELGRLLRQTGQQPMISIDHDKLILRVIKADSSSIECVVFQDGVLGSKKHVLIPEISLSVCYNPLKYIIHGELQWGIQWDIDMIFASLIDAYEIHDVRNVYANYGKRIKVFAKIENIEGLKKFNEILKAADGIVLVRDELSKSIKPQDMFFVQKAIVSQCNKEGKPVVITGEVLESMLGNPQPSRYECLDISTMVLDGADCIELTSVTTDGKFPKEAVASLSTACRTAEAAILYDQIFLERSNEVEEPVEASHASVTAAVKAAISSRAKIIVCMTRSCKMACLLSRYSPPCPVIVVTRDPPVAKECLMYRGLLPIIREAEVEPDSDWMLDVEGNVRYAIKYGMALNIVQSKDTIIVLSEIKERDATRLTVETVDRYIDSVNN